ncbi:putative F-box domain-containing protein [Helianthus annuus]|nr:putative F-box domain-containing protein [Helianthus annuus]KAJ0665238.1 putative F-box domain-containing protein [Helianthus annuus]
MKPNINGLKTIDTMAEFPLEIMYDILSRMQIRSLARLRCVNKQWCNYINDPYLEVMHAKRAPLTDAMLIKFHQFPSNSSKSPCTLRFLEEEEGTCTLEVRKKPPVMEFMCRRANRCLPPFEIVLGSCNGLLYSSQGRNPDGSTTLVAINPLRRECYKLPPINTPKSEPLGRFVESSSGLGFDDSTHTFKMVCVMKKFKEDLYTMVHVLGTNSWRKIPQIPSYPIKGEGVFANGCLHWLIRDRYDYYGVYLAKPLISFDMAKEEFGLINLPQELPSNWGIVRLVYLHGEVGYVYHIRHKLVVWVLKEKGWVRHCEIEEKPSLRNLKVLGFWNVKGDVLMLDKCHHRMFVYNLKSDTVDEVSLIGWNDTAGVEDIRMYQRSFVFNPLFDQKLMKKS